MPRGNGHKAKSAMTSGKLSGFVKPPDDSGGSIGNGEYVDWLEVNGNYVYGAVASVVRAGGALLLGRSQDGTQYSIRVYDGGVGTSYYFRCSASGVEELEKFLLALIAIHED